MDAFTREDNNYTNPAMIISNKVDGIVYSWDGSISFNFLSKEARLSHKQNHFYEDLIKEENYPNREPIGEVMYQNGKYMGKR